MWCVEQLVALPKVGVLQAAMLARYSIALGVAAHPEASKPQVAELQDSHSAVLHLQLFPTSQHICNNAQQR